MTVKCSIRLTVQAIEVDGKVLNLIGCALQVVDLIPRVAADGHTLMVNTPSLLPPPHPFSPVQVAGFGNPNKHRMAKFFFHSFGGKPSCFPSRRGGCYGLSAPTHADIFFMDPIEVGGTSSCPAERPTKAPSSVLLDLVAPRAGTRAPTTARTGNEAPTSKQEAEPCARLTDIWGSVKCSRWVKVRDQLYFAG